VQVSAELEGDPFSAAPGSLQAEAAGLECFEDFAFLRTQDARKNQASARVDGCGDLWGGQAQDFAEDIGHHKRVAPARFPAEEIFAR
jgi:hypothetical protein